MKLKKITLDYDEEADVLYLSFGKPKKAVTEEINNVGVRQDEKTGEIVGLTVIEFLKTFKTTQLPIKIAV